MLQYLFVKVSLYNYSFSLLIDVSWGPLNNINE